MSLENLLRDAIERASEGRVSILLLRFATPAGEVEFDALLLSELRKLHRIGQKLGYPNMDVLAKRDEESTSANPGKMVHIELRRWK